MEKRRLNQIKSVFEQSKHFARKLGLKNSPTFSQTYCLAVHDCDTKGDIRIIILMNLLQDVTRKHLDKLGYGADFLSHQQGWVVTRYAIKIKKYPRRDEKIKILTWISETKRMSLIREFQLVNQKGETLVEAISKWGLVDLANKKMLSMPPFDVYPKKLFTHSYDQPELKDDCCSKHDVVILYDNIDFNHHVNNSLYALWASESVEKEFRLNHSPKEMAILFKKEAIYGERLSVSTQIEEDKGQFKSFHRVTSDGGVEHASVTIVW